MANMEMSRYFWKDKTVLVTGHTGFKGAWLSLWLQKLGAKVVGYSLNPPTTPNLFEVARVGPGMISIHGDILDEANFRTVVQSHRPNIIFHLAAQSLVRQSYANPVDTLAVNVIGTANILNTVRDFRQDVKVLLNVTSDKCYENREWVWGYREDDVMGGYDPYSCSKGCAELVTAAFRKSFFNNDEMKVGIATARAGNVIGGGDWAEDRLIPDAMRALTSGKKIVVRNPDHIRPWQHVLEPLGGYMLLAARLWGDQAEHAEGWNFGPREDDVRSVRWVADNICTLWGNGADWTVTGEAGQHEARLLKLDCSKARSRLDWKPRWNLQQGLEKTVAWYKGYADAADMHRFTLEQIDNYEEALV